MTVELCIADHQTIRQANTHPTVLDHVDSQARFAGSEIAVNFQSVVDAAQRRFDRRRSRFRIGR